MAGANPDCQTGARTGPEGARRQAGHFRHRPLADLTDPTVSVPVRSQLHARLSAGNHRCGRSGGRTYSAESRYLPPSCVSPRAGHRSHGTASSRCHCRTGDLVKEALACVMLFTTVSSIMLCVRLDRAAESSLSSRPRGQIDPQQRLDLPHLLGAESLQQKRHQVVLPWLPEHHPVDGKGALERFELRRVPAQR